MTLVNRDTDKHLQQLAVKNLLHVSAARLDCVPESLQEFYLDACSRDHAQHAEVLAGPPPGESRRIFAPPQTAFRDLTPYGDADFLGVEAYGQRLMRASLDSGLEAVPVPFGATAVTATKEGYAVLSAPEQRVFLLDKNLAPLASCAAQEVGITVSLSTRITEAGDLLAIAVAERREVLFVSKALRVTAKGQLPRASCLNDIAGYEGGALLSEAVPSSNDCGGLLWVHADGTVRSIMEGLARPLGLSVSPQGVIVCGFSGVHLLRTRGLTVTGHQLLPWERIASRIDARSGYLYEAVARGGVLTAIVRLASGGINRNTNFCLFECGLPQEAGGERQREACR